MIGIYTKKELEGRMDEQFDSFMDYVDGVEEEINVRIDALEELFEQVLGKSTELIAELNVILAKKSPKPKKPIAAKTPKSKGKK